jgi:hypothetical protein
MKRKAFKDLTKQEKIVYIENIIDYITVINEEMTLKNEVEDLEFSIYGLLNEFTLKHGKYNFKLKCEKFFDKSGQREFWLYGLPVSIELKKVNE